MNNLVDAAGVACRQRGYTPRLFIMMRNELGTLGAIKKLITSGSIESGLDRVLDLGLRDHTLERIALKCHDEFTPVELQCARWKLEVAEAARMEDD